MFASCAQDIKFYDWDTTNGYGVYKPLSDKPKQGLYFNDLSWSCEGTYLVAVQSSGKNMLLKPNLNPIFRSDPCVVERDLINVANVKCAQFTKTQNNLVALGTAGGHVIHHNLVSKYSTVVVEDLPGSANIVNYAAGDSYLAAACSNGQIFIVQAGVGVTESYFVPHSECITALTTHLSIPKLMAGGSDQGVIAVWDVNSSSFVMQTSITNEKVRGIAFSPTDDTFTAISGNHKIGIYDLRVGECVHEKHFDATLTTLSYSPRGNDIAVGTDKGHILSMDKRYLRSCKTALKAHDQHVRKIKFQHEYNDHFNYRSSPKESRCSLFQEPERERELPEPDLRFGQSGDFHGRYPHPHPKMEAPSKVRFAPTPTQINPENNIISPTPTQKAVGEMSLFHIVDERSLHEFKQNILQSTKEVIDRVVDQVNNDFLKMRMNASREFCNMELRNRDRWQDFNDTLLKIACLDDRRLAEEMNMGAMIHETAVKDSTVKKKVAKETKPPPPPPEDDQDYSEEIVSYDNLNVYSDHILDQQEIELDQLDYLDTNIVVSTKQAVARVTTSQASGYPPAVPSTSQNREETRKDVSPIRYASKLPRQKASQQKAFFRQDEF